MIGVVLDTNVLVSANLNGDGLEAFVVSLALTGQLQLYISQPILQEYERVLRYARLKFIARDIEAVMQEICQVGSLVTPTNTIHAAKHEADNRFLECAEIAEAEFLVTGNKRHFSTRWKATQIVNAREFFERAAGIEK